MNLRPFTEVLRDAEKYAAAGATVHQRFACEACGNDTLGIEEPNTFYTHGACDKCGHTTDLEKTGCNFLVVLGQ
jgi:hypothetical protein